MKAGVFFPQGRYDIPIGNLPITQPYQEEGQLFRVMGEGYNVQNMHQLGFPNHKFSAPMQESSIDYNCIGWAFDADLFIEPEIEKKLVTKESLLEFIWMVIETHPNVFLPNNMILRMYTEKEDETQLLSYDPERVFQENDIIFYFGKNQETKILGYEEKVLLHAARYFDVSRPHGGNQDLKWTSKIGETLLVSHNLDDLVGTTYGNIEVMLVASIDTEDKTEILY